ncbi:hypothetical protein KIPB_009152 [Kipferlia bialata]|uniref:Uncharacterized protein n=1 Tax=Kipferlia bialata TaxID=797122 RepID=A0A9K3GM22_9EUKA|nr:hypothetical protein KIPB_009152 [Kipferlia bialata]|eukprot:g9152.t1
MSHTTPVSIHEIREKDVDVDLIQRRCALKKDDISGVLEVTRMDLSYAGLTTLDGVTLCTELQHLTAGYNSVTSLEPLTFLPNLQTLCMPSNRISRITKLTDLVSLRALDLSYNSITALPPVSYLPPGLTLLDISGNPVVHNEIEMEMFTELIPDTLKIVTDSKPVTRPEPHRPYTAVVRGEMEGETEAEGGVAKAGSKGQAPNPHTMYSGVTGVRQTIGRTDKKRERDTTVDEALPSHVMPDIGQAMDMYKDLYASVVTSALSRGKGEISSLSAQLIADSRKRREKILKQSNEDASPSADTE